MVYLVEDDENIRELVTYTLNSQGIETESFERPSKFWKAMRQEIPSLFLLDIILPEEDGLSILKKIKNTSQTKKLPVIMLTAKGSEYDTVLGLDSGADDYIAKPFRMMELISRVRLCIKAKRSGGTGKGQRISVWKNLCLSIQTYCECGRKRNFTYFKRI